MFYDLNEQTENSTGIDRFILSGKTYEIGQLWFKTKFAISGIDPKKEILSQIRPIVESVMNEWNDDIPKFSDSEIDTLYRFIIQKLNV